MTFLDQLRELGLGREAVPGFTGGQFGEGSTAGLPATSGFMGTGGDFSMFGQGANGRGFGNWAAENKDLLSGAFKAFQTGANLYGGVQQLDLAKKQFNSMREFGNININNQMKSYNTRIADRARSRGLTEGQSPEEIASYTSRNSLSR